MYIMRIASPHVCSGTLVSPPHAPHMAMGVQKPTRLPTYDSQPNHAPMAHAQQRQRVIASALSPADVAPVIAAAVLPIAGIAGWRLSLYSQLEVITARMIGTFVPKDASVVQLGGTTKELYYYPRTTRQVTVVGEDVKPGLFEQGGIQAQVPTRARQQPCTNLSFIPDASVDAVVCLRSLTSLGAVDRQQQALAEASRVLRPGAPLIFIEPLSDGASPLRGLIGNTGKATPVAASSLEDLLDRPALDVLQVDVALQGADPHAVGVARRTTSAATGFRSAAQDSRAPGPEEAIRKSKKRDLSASSDKGFRKDP